MAYLELRMFFTSFGILACVGIGLALLYLAYSGFDRWFHTDGSVVGLIIRVPLPFIVGLVVLYLTFSHAPIKIVAG